MKEAGDKFTRHLSLGDLIMDPMPAYSITP